MSGYTHNSGFSAISNGFAVGKRGHEIPVISPSGEFSAFGNKGKTYFVDTVSGSNSKDGLSWDNAFLTMAKAFTVIASRETIYFVGKVREQLIAPLGVYGVKIIGADTTPRHDLAASWMAPASGSVDSKALCEILEQGWAFINILFQSQATTAPAIEISRAEDAVHPDGSHALFVNCRFCGCDGIWLNGGIFNTRFINCQFYDLTGTGIKNTSVSIDNHTHLLIDNCDFVNNAAAIVTPMKWSWVKNSHFFGNTVGIDSTGSVAGNAFIDLIVDEPNATFNNTHGWTGVAGDVWKVHCTDQVRYGIPTVA
jgi:hypothetical protein